MSRVMILLLLLALPGSADAQQAGLVSHWRGNDIELVPGVPAGSCVGDLYRAEFTPWWRSQLVGPRTACPITMSGDGQLTGVEETIGYFLQDPATSAAASVAFRTERHLDVVGFDPSTPLANIYFVTVPMIPGVDDVANSAATEQNKCVGDASGPASGDGILNADDLLCSWWSSRSTGQGSMMISRRDEASATWHERVAFVDPGTGLVDFQGAWTEPLDPDNDGYMVSVDGVVGTSNRVIVVGGHDPSFVGRPISPATDTMFLLPVPHHYIDETRNVDSLVCGIDGVDWCDCDRDGVPDYCSRGVFDGTHQVTVLTFDNDPLSPTANAYLARSASAPLGSLTFTGPRFSIEPGQAYLVIITSSQQPVTWLLAHH